MKFIVMKNLVLFILFGLMVTTFTYAQEATTHPDQREAIHSLIDQYAQARETKDSVLLKRILTAEVDQLVSSGEWRRGIRDSVVGMLRSSSRNPGERTLTVDNVRFLNPQTALADARYEIRNTDGSVRKMWSTFVVVYDADTWKIAAIRNMLPS